MPARHESLPRKAQENRISATARLVPPLPLCRGGQVAPSDPLAATRWIRIRSPLMPRDEHSALPPPRVAWQGHRRCSKCPESITRNFRNPHKDHACCDVRRCSRCALTTSEIAGTGVALDAGAPIEANDGSIARILGKRPVLWVGAGLSIAAGYPTRSALIDALVAAADDPIDRTRTFYEVVDAVVVS